jgi:hypothetical protein
MLSVMGVEVGTGNFRPLYLLPRGTVDASSEGIVSFSPRSNGQNAEHGSPAVRLISVTAA